MGFGYFSGDELRIKVTVSKDEKALLLEAAKLIDMMTADGKYQRFSKICGHNFNGFDGPIMGRKMVMHGIRIPNLLNPMGKKTWDLAWLDTMVLWSMGEWNGKCSLDRMCYALGIDTPKGEISGADVKDYFYGATPTPDDLPFGKFDKEEARFGVIAKYQGGDIVALAQSFLKLHGEPLIPANKIVFV